MNGRATGSSLPSYSIMLSIVHPSTTQDLHYTHYQPHLSHQQGQSYHLDNYTRSTAMPHRVRDMELVRAPSATSTTSTTSTSVTSTCSCDASVAQALEIARESYDGAQDPTVSKILENALSSIWGKVEAAPESYIMTRDEFSVFNYFQHRFVGDTTARLARARYWDHASA